MRTLAKVGLVELDDDELRGPDGAPAEEMSDDEARRIIAEASGRSDDATQPAPAARAEPEPLVDLPAATTIEEGQSFETLYEEAGVRPSPFSAEKLLRLLEGLKVMDPASRKTAVRAMDSADDSWTIEDPMIDAQRKIGALEAGKRRLAEHVGHAQAKAEADLKAQAEYEVQATEEIRKQIAELEALLQREVHQVAEQRAKIQAEAEATRQAATRESARLDAEIGRLAEITKLFSQPTSEPGSQ